MNSSSGERLSGDSFFSASRLNLLAPLLIAALTLLAYANILNNSLFLDDLDFIVNNAYLRDWRYFPRLFSESMTAGAAKTGDYYRPMMQVLFLSGYSLWELNPMGYHLLSIFFHAANGYLLYRLILAVCGEFSAALAAALIFIVHPAQTEAVASASALGILLGLFFGLAALLLHMKRNVRATALALVAAALAILSKETMVVLPGMIFLASYFFLRSGETESARFRKSLLDAAPYLAIAGIYVALRFTILNFGGTGNLFRADNVFTASWTARLYTFLDAFKELIQITVWPTPLFMERSTLIPVYLTPLAGPVLFGAALFTGMIAAGAVLAFRRPGSLGGRMAAAGLFWFLFCMVPVSNVIIPISTTIVESWLYMPIAGLLIGLSGLALSLRTNAGGPRFRIAGSGAGAAALALLIALCLYKTVTQNRVWNNPVAFYEHNLAHAPESARFRNNLAMAYSDQKRYPEAIEQYQKAILSNDQYPETHHNLALLYLETGNAASAEREFHRAIEMNPRFHFSYLSLAALYANLKRLDLAERVLQTLVQYAPERWEGYYNLGIVRSMMGDRAGARTLWQKGLEADPYNKNLREILEKN